MSNNIQTTTANTINVKDFILEDEPAEIEKVSKAKRNYVKPNIEWEIVLQDAVDAVVRRKTKQTSRLLVLLMSKGQFYIKDEKTNQIEALTPENLSNFTKGMQPMDIVPWSTSFKPGKRGLEKFIETMNNEDFQWLARRGEHTIIYASFKFEDGRWELHRKRELLSDNVRASYLKFLDDYANSQELDCFQNMKVTNLRAERSVDNFKQLTEMYGIDRARTFITRFLEAQYVGTEFPELWRLTELNSKCNFEFNRMVQYIFFDSVRQGHGVVGQTSYRSSISRFIDLWTDTLEMQMQVFGKIRDKYPDNLISMHQMLSFKSALHKIIIDEERFKSHSERLSENMFRDNQFLIRPPYNKEDMIDEATQQANCLASYTEAYASNKTDIYFMRSVKEPEKSLVTVEVRDGAVRQAYLAMNQIPEEDHVKWLTNWAVAHGIKMIDVHHQRPLGA